MFRLNFKSIHLVYVLCGLFVYVPLLWGDQNAQPEHSAWRIDAPILKLYAILDTKEKLLYPIQERPITPADIPHIESYWNRQGVFDWPCLIDPEIETRRASGQAKAWQLAPGIPNVCEKEEKLAIWGMELTRNGKKTIEGMIAWKELPEQGKTEIRYGETRLGGGYQGVGTIGLAFAVQTALLKGYEPYVDAYKFVVPDGRPSPIEWFKRKGLVPTFSFDTSPESVRLVFPDLDAAKKFLQKVQGYMEKDPIAPSHRKEHIR